MIRAPAASKWGGASALRLGSLLGAAALLGAVASASGAARVQSVRAISLHSPFPGPCGRQGNPLFARNSDVEPSVAVDPGDPRKVVVAWIQDDGSTDVVAASRDGGRTFARALVPGLTRCTGGTDPVAGDPVVAFGRDGRVLLAAGVGDLGRLSMGLPPLTRMAVSRSVDGGFSWSIPSFPQPRTGDYWDKPWVTLDPRHPNRAYYVWSQRTGPDRDTGNGYFSRSGDFGRTWSARRLMARGTATSFPQSNMILVLPSGALVDVFVLGSTGAPRLGEMAERSTDGGRRWSPPARIGVATNAAPVDKRTRADVVGFAFALPSSAVGPDGTLYVAWNDVRPGRTSRIMVGRSTDGGRSWSTRAVVRSRAQVFGPSIAVAGDGTVGVSYYRIAQASRPNGDWPATVRLATSRDRARHWGDQPLAGPFNMLSSETLPGTRSHRIGDYFGIAGLPHGFIAAFVMAKPLAKIGPQDVFVARIRTS